MLMGHTPVPLAKWTHLPKSSNATGKREMNTTRVKSKREGGLRGWPGRVLLCVLACELSVAPLSYGQPLVYPETISSKAVSISSRSDSRNQVTEKPSISAAPLTSSEAASQGTRPDQAKATSDKIRENRPGKQGRSSEVNHGHNSDD